jgi:amino acid transporter
VPGAGNICASAIQGFAVVANSSYVPKAWQLVLLTVLICSFAILFNIFLASRLPGIEAAVFVMYSLGFVAFFIILLVMGPRSSAKEVFTDFQDNAGWGSIGTACFVGISGPVITLIGADSSVHMAEELKDASRQLPKAMIATAIVNYILGFLMTVAFIAVLGDINQDISSPTGLPYVQVIWNATESATATMVMVAFIIFFFIFCAVNQNTTSSRQLYAFARDGGLPFSAWVSYVSFFPLIIVGDTKNSLGITNPKYSYQRRNNQLGHCLWPCLHSPRFHCCILEHSNHRQFGPASLLYHLHWLPLTPPKHCRPLRYPLRTSTLLSR